MDSRAKTAFAIVTSAVVLTCLMHVPVHAATPIPKPLLAAIHTPIPVATVKPGAGIAIKTVAFPMKTGVQVNLQVTNVTVSSQRLEFATSARIAITATQNGCVIWNSLAGKRFVESASSVIMQGGDIATFSDFWLIKPGSVTGPVVLHARLVSTPPKKAKPLMIDIVPAIATPLADGSIPKPTLSPTLACATPTPTVLPTSVHTPLSSTSKVLP